MTLDSKVPSGPIQDKWDKHRFDLKRVNPANKRKYTIIVVGTGLRASYNANTRIVDPVRADAAYYLVYAYNLINHSTFSKDRTAPPVPDSYWAPGYPVFLASVIKISELLETDAYTSILISQLLLGIGTLFICFLVAASFLPGYWSLLPPFLVAISPHLISTASYILTETLFGFLLILSLYVVIKAITSAGCFNRI